MSTRPDRRPHHARETEGAGTAPDERCGGESRGRPNAGRRVAITGALLALALLCAGSATATQEYVLPTLFDVTGVEAGDVLNIRAAPSAGAEIIGALDHDARDVEVVAHDRTGSWGQVNTAERSGWVALRYLAYRTGVWEGGSLPSTLRCLGTEPFWSLRPEDGAVVFSTPEKPDRTLALETLLATGIFRDPRRALVARDTEGRLTSVMTTAACSDGMSDRAYGLEINVILEDSATAQLLTGCCSVAP